MNEYMIQAFVDEMAKIATQMPVASVAPAAAPTAASTATSAASKPGFLRRNIRPIALMAAGAGLHSVGQNAWNDYQTGRMVRKQNEAANAGMF